MYNLMVLKKVWSARWAVKKRKMDSVDGKLCHPLEEQKV